jgi:broad specificity phosphatase PhoE
MISWLRSMQLPDRVGEPPEMEGSDAMTLDEILQGIHALEEDLLVFERKYGILTETFYEAYRRGEEPEDDAWVLDWSEWAGTYEILLDLQERYRRAIESLLQEPNISSLSHLIGQTARHEPLAVTG